MNEKEKKLLKIFPHLFSPSQKLQLFFPRFNPLIASHAGLNSLSLSSFPPLHPAALAAAQELYADVYMSSGGYIVRVWMRRESPDDGCGRKWEGHREGWKFFSREDPRMKKERSTRRFTTATFLTRARPAKDVNFSQRLFPLFVLSFFLFFVLRTFFLHVAHSLPFSLCVCVVASRGREKKYSFCHWRRWRYKAAREK